MIEQAGQGQTRFLRPWGGVTGQAVDGSLAEAMGMAVPEGVVLNDLHSESPFTRAGLQSGDVILSLAGQPTNTPEEVYFRMATLGIGTEAVVRYLRNARCAMPMSRSCPPPTARPRDTRTIMATWHCAA